jgi:hypothetical protein
MNECSHGWYGAAAVRQVMGVFRRAVLFLPNFETSRNGTNAHSYSLTNAIIALFLLLTIYRFPTLIM